MSRHYHQQAAVILATLFLSAASLFHNPTPALSYSKPPNHSTAATAPSAPAQNDLPHNSWFEIPLSKNDPAHILAVNMEGYRHDILPLTKPHICHPRAYGPWKNEICPTCNTDGTEVRYCTVCRQEQSRSIPATGHTYSCIASKAPTVFTAGYKLYRCSNCGKEYTRSVPKLSALENDLCGESLLEQVLPNAPYPSFTKQALSRWSAKLTYDEATALGPISMPKAGTRKVLQSWEVAYQYLTVPYAYTILGAADGTAAFNCWVMPDAAAKQAETYAQVYRILAALGIDSSVTKQEAAKRINEWICAFKQYDYSEADPDPSPYHSLFVSEGRCHNYALAFQLLCLGAGIECHYYSSHTMNHAWNKVYFSDGSLLWVDVTWNDTTNSTDYLLINTETLCKTHSL